MDRVTLRRQSREPAFLTKLFFGIVAIGLAIAFVVGLLPQRIELFSKFVSGLTAPEDTADLPSSEKVIQLLLVSKGSEPKIEQIRTFLADTESAPQFFLAFRNALLAPDTERGRHALAELRSETEKPTPLRHACRLLGEIRFVQNDYPKALELFEREGRGFADALTARQRTVGLAIKRENVSLLQKLRSDPAFEDAFDVFSERETDALMKDYPALFISTARGCIESIRSPVIIFFTLLAGITWASVIALTGHISRKAALLIPIAVFLGILSVVPTLVALELQDIKPNGEVLQDAIFYIASVGLREESAKLLCFALLVPWLLLRKASDVEALVLASCVGLGFAIEENMNYFQALVSPKATGRFLTANFLHLALTGIVGLAFYRFCRSPKNRWEQCIASFLFVVVAHGVYDLVIANPVISGELGVASFFFLVFLAFRYFSILSQVRDSGSNVLSPLAVFVVGCAIMVATAAAVIGALLPYNMVLQTVLRTFEAEFPIALAFFYCFRDE